MLDCASLVCLSPDLVPSYPRTADVLIPIAGATPLNARYRWTTPSILRQADETDEVTDTSYRYCLEAVYTDAKDRPMKDC